MATPRKYPTLAEFEGLKASVARIEAAMPSKPIRASVYIDADEIAERLGLVDSYGVPVAVGDSLQRVDMDITHRISSITVRAASQERMATVTVETDDGKSITAVDMRLPGHMVIKKATA